MITLIIPYYNQPLMLERQVEEIRKYPKGYKIIVVDDCSHVPAKKYDGIDLYRIETDIPWNRGGARNLGVHVCETEWLIHVDIDHVLPAECAERLLEFIPDSEKWYRFERYRVGKADGTRRKDSIPDDCEYGKIHPHIDSYLVTKLTYWKAGGYDERYSGCLGGGSPFLEQLSRTAEMEILPDEIHLCVYTRSVIRDSSASNLSRDTSEYKRRRNRIGSAKANNPLRFVWNKIHG